MGKMVGYVIVLGTHYSCMMLWRCVSGKDGGVCHSAGYTL